MLEIKGKVSTAICYAKVIETEAIDQIRRMCDYPMTQNSRIRIMPDVHGAGRIMSRTKAKNELGMGEYKKERTRKKWQHGAAMPTIDDLVAQTFVQLFVVG